jgi:hypothetical protein
VKIITKGQKVLYVLEYHVIPAVKCVELLSDGMSYIVLKRLWCDIIVLNAHEPIVGKSRVKVMIQSTVSVKN